MRQILSSYMENIFLFQKSFALPEDSSKDNHCSGSNPNTFQLDLCKMDIDNINNSDCVMRGVPHSVSGGKRFFQISCIVQFHIITKIDLNTGAGCHGCLAAVKF